MDGDQEQEPPNSVTYGLEEALELLSVLESARTTFRDTSHLVGVAEMGDQIRILSRRLGFDGEASMATEPLWARDAAERLGVSIKELLRLAYDRKIRYVMVDGIAHFPEDALDEYQRRSAG